MTWYEFQVECGKVLIDPCIAIENNEIKSALVARDDEKVIQLLSEEC